MCVPWGPGNVAQGDRSHLSDRLFRGNWRVVELLEGGDQVLQLQRRQLARSSHLVADVARCENLQKRGGPAVMKVRCRRPGPLKGRCGEAGERPAEARPGLRVDGSHVVHETARAVGELGSRMA